LARFPRRSRLLKPSQFRATFAEGRREHGEFLVAVVRATQEDTPRLGLAIARKMVPTSVQRNLVKRMVREVFRQRCERLAPCDIVITAKPPARDAERRRLRADVEQLWTRIERRWPRIAAQNAAASRTR